MRTRINEVPACLIETIEVEAERYNLIRLALIRLGGPLRFPLIGLRNLDMYLDDEKWVCVDRSAMDLPVAAWSRFEDKARTDLQGDVRCVLRHYQVNTDILLPYMWMTMESILRDRLAQQKYTSSSKVVHFSANRNSLSKSE